MATSELLNNILINLDNKNVVTGLFLDLKKAFDTVNHKILIKKLEFAGIRGRFLNLFESYLLNIKQYVQLW